MAYLNTKQVAAALGVCIGTVRRMYREGELSYVRLGYRSIRFNEEDVAEMARGRFVAADGGKENSVSQPKTAEYWERLGYKRSPLPSTCPACSARVEVWSKPGRRQSQAPLVILVDPQTFEAHWSQCQKAKLFRTEQQRQAGAL